MKNVASVLLVLLVLGAVLPPAWACSPSFRHCAVVKKATVQHYVAPVYYYPATFIQPYFVAYDGNADALLQELRGIRRELQAIKSAPAGAVTGLQVVQRRCAECHSQANADAKGKGFVMLDNDNKAVPWSLNEKRRIGVRTGSKGADRMPPHPHEPLSDAEKTALEKFLNGEE